MAGNVTRREDSVPPGVRGMGDPEGLQREPLRCVEKTEAAVQQGFR